MSKRKFSKKEVAISIAAAALAIATVGGAVAIHKDSSKYEEQRKQKSRPTQHPLKRPKKTMSKI